LQPPSRVIFSTRKPWQQLHASSLHYLCTSRTLWQPHHRSTSSLQRDPEAVQPPRSTNSRNNTCNLKQHPWQRGEREPFAHTVVSTTTNPSRCCHHHHYNNAFITSEQQRKPNLHHRELHATVPAAPANQNLHEPDSRPTIQQPFHAPIVNVSPSPLCLKHPCHRTAINACEPDPLHDVTPTSPTSNASTSPSLHQGPITRSMMRKIHIGLSQDDQVNHGLFTLFTWAKEISKI